MSAEKNRPRLEVDDSVARALVRFDEDDEAGGLATAGVTGDADAPTSWGLYSINTIKATHRSGDVARMLDAALEERSASV